MDNFFDTGEIPKLKREEDPFWDPPKPYFMGQAFQKMMSLGYMLDNPSDLVIVGERGSIGQLKANIIPTDGSGEFYMGDILEERGEVVDDPMMLLDRPLFFKVIISGLNLNDNNWRNVYVEYSFQGEGGKIETYQT